MASQNDDDLESNPQSLLTIFEEGLDLYNNLGKIDEPTNSFTVQINVKKAIRIFENATRLVSLAGIFSTNEDIEEIATENLRYILLPALLGALCLKLTSGDRRDITNVAEIYYKDFLQRCNNYGLSNYKFKDSSSENDSVVSQQTAFEEIRHSVNTRAGKIQRFKEQKELRSKLEDLKSNMENENVDDDIKRNYFMTMIKLFIYEAIDELASIEAEKEILVHIANFSKEDRPKPKGPVPKPLKPVIITKDAVQKAVFGAGYPSLPVMSVQEFYDQRVREGVFPDPHIKKDGPICLQDATIDDIQNQDAACEEEKEKRIEEDDPEHLEEMRRRDDFKDDHRRGWGNRMNRS